MSDSARRKRWPYTSRQPRWCRGHLCWDSKRRGVGDLVPPSPCGSEFDLLERARRDLPVRVAADSTARANEVALPSCACVVNQLTLQPRHCGNAVPPAVVLVVGPAMPDGRIHTVEHRDLRGHRFEITLAVRIRDVALAAGDDDHG